MNCKVKDFIKFYKIFDILHVQFSLAKSKNMDFLSVQTKDYRLISSPIIEETYKILLAFSGLKHALTSNTGYNDRVAECQEAASVLLR